MARKPIPSLLGRPAELWGHRHDPKWSKEGQKIANQMARYVFSALAISSKTQPQIPRILAYPRTPRPNGTTTLPNSTAGAVYYPSNYIAVQVPADDEAVHNREYAFIERSPIIGEYVAPPRVAFIGDLAHEMAHWVIDRVYRDRKATAHGRKWRLAYALLREKFVNH